MRGARRLLLLTALLSAAGVSGALPADAVGVQHCQLVKGTLAVSPGLTDQATDHNVNLGARVLGCSRSGGSGFLLANTGAYQATCANFTTSLQPTTATIAWANGRSSTIAMTFGSLPGSPNRLALSGRVVSGAGLGNRIDGGLHLIAPFTRIIAQPDHHQKQQQQLPLAGKGGTCTVANPLVTIKFASYQSFKFSTTDSGSKTTPGSGAKNPQSSPSSGSTTSTSMVAEPTLPPPRAAGPPPKTRPVQRVARPTLLPKVQQSAAVSNVGGSDSLFDPESVLGVACIAVAVLLLIALLWPSRRGRRRRPVSRLIR